MYLFAISDSRCEDLPRHNSSCFRRTDCFAPRLTTASFGRTIACRPVQLFNLLHIAQQDGQAGGEAVLSDLEEKPGDP